MKTKLATLKSTAACIATTLAVILGSLLVGDVLWTAVKLACGL